MPDSQVHDVYFTACVQQSNVRLATELGHRFILKKKQSGSGLRIRGSNMPVYPSVAFGFVLTLGK